jgi:hypothetical protein
MVIKNPKDEKKIAFEGKKFPIQSEMNTYFQIVKLARPSFMPRALIMTKS